MRPACQHGGVVLRALRELARSEYFTLFFFLPALLMGSLHPGSPAAGQENSRAASATGVISLEVLLERMANVAQLYDDNALRFSCEEEITYTHFASSGRVEDRRRYSLEYMYTFEAAPPSPEDPEGDRRGKLVDYRTIRDDQAPEGSYREIDLEELALPNYLKRAYSWVFIFERPRQELYDFQIVGEDDVNGTAALIVRFDPIPPYVMTENDWFGRAWIDKESFQLLRVEANSSDALTDDPEAGGEEIERDVHGAQTYTVTRVTTEFAIEKNGMRFPSHAVLAASVSRRLADEAALLATITGRMEGHDEEVRTVFRVDQTYDNYRFFNVRSESEIRDTVMGIRRS